MSDARAHLRNGLLVFRNGRLELCGCCPGGPGGCVPTSTSCPCAPGCFFNNCNRISQRAVGSVDPTTGQYHVETTLNYQIPYESCCTNNENVAWSVYIRLTQYARGTCAGLCLQNEVIIQGAGVGTIPVTLSGQVVGSGGPCSPSPRPPTTRQISPVCGSPLTTLSHIQAVYGPFIPNVPLLAIPSLFNDGIRIEPEILNSSLYRDCSAFVGQEVASASLGSTNPCAGILTTSEVLIYQRAVGCTPVGSVCGACCCAGICYADTTAAACHAMGGRHYLGRGCDQVSCVRPTPTGACCLPTGVCIQTARQNDCESRGGIYQGPDIPCGLIICPGPPTRACCLPPPLTGCVEASQIACQQLGGTWSPTLHCTPTLCAGDPIGGCCFEDGRCFDLTGDQCANAGGRWMQGRPCSEVDCGIGACCSCAAHSQPTCSVGTIEQCHQLFACGGGPGIFMGAGTNCQTVSCAGDAERQPIVIASAAEVAEVARSRNRGRTCAGCSDGIGF